MTTEKRNTKWLLPIALGLLTITLPYLLAQDASPSAPKQKAAPSPGGAAKAPGTTKGRQPIKKTPPPPPPAPEAKKDVPERKMSFQELADLCKRDVSNELRSSTLKRRGLETDLEMEDLVRLIETSGRTPAMLGSFYDELKGLIPPEVSRENAAVLIPALLNRIAANPSDLELLDSLHPALRENRGRLLSAFADYQKHSLGITRQLENSRRLAVPLFVYTKSGVERLAFVVFSPAHHGKLALRDVIATTQELANQHLRAELQLAETRLRDVYREVNTGNAKKTQDALATPGLNASLEKIGGWRRMIRKLNMSQAELTITPAASPDMTSLRLVLGVSQPLANTGNQRLQYDAEFERIQGDVRLVRLRDKQGRDIAADPDLVCYLGRRYGVDGCSPYVMSSSEEAAFATLESLNQICERRLQAYDGIGLEAAAEEMRVSFPSDKDTTGLGYLAAAQFLQKRFELAEKTALSVIRRGDKVRLPLLRYYPFKDQSNFKRVMLVFSQKQLEYEGTPESGNERFQIPWAEVTKFDLEPKVGLIPRLGQRAPLIHLEVHYPNEQGRKREADWHFAVFPTGCIPQTQQQLPQGFERYTAGNACFGSIPGNYVRPQEQPNALVRGFAQFPVPGGNGQVNQLVAPVGWRDGLLTLQRLVSQVKSGPN